MDETTWIPWKVTIRREKGAEPEIVWRKGTDAEFDAWLLRFLDGLRRVQELREPRPPP